MAMKMAAPTNITPSHSSAAGAINPSSPPRKKPLEAIKGGANPCANDNADGDRCAQLPEVARHIGDAKLLQQGHDSQIDRTGMMCRPNRQRLS